MAVSRQVEPGPNRRRGVHESGTREPMSRVILAGGTDAGEVALFSCDALPERPGGDAIGALESAGRALRLETRTDGSYLLHLYVDQPAPPEIEAWLDANDTVEYDFVTESGRIGFGGVESACAGFEPNPAVRTDAEIPPGRYRAVAFYTNYPDERLEEEIEAKLGKAGAVKVNRPANITIAAAILVVSMIILGVADTPWYFAAAAAVAAGAGFWVRRIKRTGEYRELVAAKRDVERRFPSVVVKLTRREAEA